MREDINLGIFGGSSVKTLTINKLLLLAPIRVYTRNICFAIPILPTSDDLSHLEMFHRPGNDDLVSVPQR